MKIDSDKDNGNNYTSISFGKADNYFLKWIHSKWSKQRGRAFILKKLVKYFPGINVAALRIHNYLLPLDLRNDADIGYFYDEGIAHERFYEQVLLALINKDSVFYDIGSNLGYYSLLLSPLVKQVYAFEPNPALADRLVKAVKGNVIPNVDVFNIGLSSTSSQMTFYFDASRHNLGSFLKTNTHKDSIEVSVMPLEEVIQKDKLLPADILKIDTEGFELPVLEGFSSVQTQRPILLIEWENEQEGEKSKYEKLNSLVGKGYHIYKICHDNRLISYNLTDYANYSNLLLMPESVSQYPAIQKWLKEA
jgi:FkbM family methyltransferase